MISTISTSKTANKKAAAPANSHGSRRPRHSTSRPSNTAAAAIASCTIVESNGLSIVILILRVARTPAEVAKHHVRANNSTYYEEDQCESRDFDTKDGQIYCGRNGRTYN